MIEPTFVGRLCGFQVSALSCQSKPQHGRRFASHFVTTLSDWSSLSF